MLNYYVTSLKPLTVITENNLPCFMKFNIILLEEMEGKGIHTET